MTIHQPQRMRREDVGPHESLCDHCTARCCRYFALPLETPTNKKDFDYIRWFLLHAHSSVFLEGETWYLIVHTECKHLQPDHRCGIYYTRPEICREYSTNDCEYDDDWVYDRYFETSEQLEEYYEATTPPGKGASIRGPKPELLPLLAV